MDAESGGQGGSNAVVWLKDAGLDYLISNKGGSSLGESDEKDAMVMFGSLTRRQSIAVQKRLREAGTSVAPVPEHPPQPRRRGNATGKPRGNSISSESPLAGRLVSSFSGPLDTPSPQKSCVSVAMGGNLLNASKRSGSYDLGKLSVVETPGVVLKSRRHVDIMEAYGNCNSSETSCVYREEADKRVRTPSSTAPQTLLFEGFPIFSLTPCDAGFTLACHDLSAADLTVVRRLAFIEASAVFDELNIRTPSSQNHSSSTNSLMSLLSGKHSSKSVSSASASSLPTSSLDVLLNKGKNRSSQQSPRVPVLIERILAELCSARCANAEGLFRIPPSQQRLRTLLQNIQSNELNDSQLDLSEVPPPDLAALLKHIIRSLSPSLLTASLEPLFVLAVADIPYDNNSLQTSNTTASVTPVPPSSIVRERLRLLNLLVLQLPDVNRETLQLVLSSLRFLAGPSANNRMTASSLALVLAPLFFPSLSHLTDSDHLHRQVLVVQLLIIYTDVLFVVPNQLLDQIRLHNTLLNQRNFVSGPKHTRKVASSWWRFWSRERVAARKLLSPTAGSPVTEDQPVLTVSVPTAIPSSPKSGKAAINDSMSLTVQVRLKSDTKAADGIEIALKNAQAVSPSIKLPSLPGQRWFLFEISGNIHERCLDPQCLLLSVYRRNPSASWELRLLPDKRCLLPDPCAIVNVEPSSSSSS